MCLYGYCRISKKPQSIDRQVRNIKKEYPDAVIVHEAFTGTKINRPEWNKLYKNIQNGDIIIFDSVSRMSRNSEEGFSLYKELFEKGISLVFLKEHHIDTDSYKKAMQGIVDINIRSGDSATDDLVHGIMAAINKFMMNKVEQDIYKAFEQSEKEVMDLHQRTKEGIETARLNGKQIGLPKGSKLVTKKSIKAKEQIRKYNKAFNGSLNNEDTWKLTGISKTAFYKYKKEMLADVQS
ncbi:MAG: recombinase family protein [Lachnospiraceae bacterium]|nr:recombinase family protein [Lachnospiraceae bacterium]